MPTAVITVGTIIGDNSTAINRAFMRKSARLSPSAASVPSTVARPILATPIIKLFLSANSH
ncbi:hypothetical protein D3C81_1115370 [compost metagenome]